MHRRAQTPPTALTPAVQRRPVAGARWAIPRRIHGVRVAITSTARSERRIAVRRPGVGIDASSASADPARAPSRVTARSCQVPGTPRSSTAPRSTRPVPEPTTRSRTVRQLHALADTAGAHRPLVYVLGKCGLRFGEVAELRWRDLDLQNLQLRISHSGARISRANAGRLRPSVQVGRGGPRGRHQ